MKVTVMYDSPDGSVTVRVTRQQANGVLNPDESQQRFLRLAASAANECVDRVREMGLFKE